MTFRQYLSVHRDKWPTLSLIARKNQWMGSTAFMRKEAWQAHLNLIDAPTITLQELKEAWQEFELSW